MFCRLIRGCFNPILRKFDTDGGLMPAKSPINPQNLPVPVDAREERVRKGFWPKLARSLSRIPFAEDAIAAFYCAFDPATPARVKGTLLAALAYFILPIDVVPDLLIGIGFTDDMAVLAAAISVVGSAITDKHRQRAKAKLAEMAG